MEGLLASHRVPLPSARMKNCSLVSWSALIETLGFAVLDLGRLKEGGRMQEGGGLLARRDLLMLANWSLWTPGVSYRNGRTRSPHCAAAGSMVQYGKPGS
jgi:hypothetical protein